MWMGYIKLKHSKCDLNESPYLSVDGLYLMKHTKCDLMPYFDSHIVIYL